MLGMAVYIMFESSMLQKFRINPPNIPIPGRNEIAKNINRPWAEGKCNSRGRRPQARLKNFLANPVVSRGQKNINEISRNLPVDRKEGTSSKYFLCCGEAIKKFNFETRYHFLRALSV